MPFLLAFAFFFWVSEELNLKVMSLSKDVDLKWKQMRKQCISPIERRYLFLKKVKKIKENSFWFSQCLFRLSKQKS